MSANGTILELRQVRRYFGGVRAVDGIDLAVAPESIVAIIGPNGAGKSTVFNLIMGQLTLTSGDILFESRSVRSLSSHVRTRLGMGRSFQITSLFPEMSLAENVQVPLIGDAGGWRRMLQPADALQRDRALDLLDEVGLHHLADQPAGELSHGDKKRLELAIVMALEPKLLLLDEPTAGMASEERTAVMDLLVRIVRRRGVAMVFTEHDMDTVFAHAERLVVMNRGTKLAEGTPEEVRGDDAVQTVYLGRSYGGKSA